MVQGALDAGLHLAFAIPDHPWVDSADADAVRIAMSVAAPGAGAGRLCIVAAEREGKGEGLEVELAERDGAIHADLKVGADVTAARALRANGGISSPGFKLHGAGFIVTPAEAAHLEADAPIKPYRNGRDLTDRPRGVNVIDLYGHNADEVRHRWPATYQRVLERVKPERDHNNRAGYRDNWWIFGEPRSDLRPAFQAAASTQAAIGLESGDSGRRNLSDGATSPLSPAPAPSAAINWPNTLPEQLATLAAALGSTPQTEQQLAAHFTGKGRWKSRLPDILAALEALGRARRLDDGRWLG